MAIATFVLASLVWSLLASASICRRAYSFEIEKLRQSRELLISHLYLFLIYICFMENPNVATSLNTQLYTSQGQYANAEPLYKRSLVIKEKVLGPDHPDVAVSLNGLAELYRMQGAANIRLLNAILLPR
jgi:Tetratricopeptide repeat